MRPLSIFKDRRKKMTFVIIFVIILVFVFHIHVTTYSSFTNQVRSLFAQWSVLSPNDIHFDDKGVLNKVPSGYFSILEKKDSTQEKGFILQSEDGRKIEINDKETLKYILGPVDSKWKAVAYTEMANSNYALYRLNTLYPQKFKVAQVDGKYWITNNRGSEDSWSNKIKRFIGDTFLEGCFARDTNPVKEVDASGNITVIATRTSIRNLLTKPCEVRWIAPPPYRAAP